jgi:hypothetical protein
MESAVMRAPETALTDDEVAALSYGRGRAWRAVLPTVDPADAEDVGQAIFRGGRSLLARGLLGDMDAEEPALDEGLATMVATALDGMVCVSAFTGDQHLTYDASGFAYLNYRRPAAAGVLVEIVDAVGLHRFGLLDAAEAGRALTGLVTAVHAGETSAESLGTVADTLCLALPADEPGQRAVFAVRPGVVETAHVAPADAGHVALRTCDLAALVRAIEDAYRA